MSFEREKQQTSNTEKRCENCGRVRPEKNKGSITSWMFLGNPCRCVATAVKEAEPGKIRLYTPSEEGVSTSTEIEESPSASAYEEEEGSEEFTSILGEHAEEPFTTPEAGDVIADRYRIVSMAGRGGMSYVFKAEDLTTGRIVALKMLRTQNVPAAAWKRFQKEAQTASLFEHPNLVSVIDMGPLGGHPFMVMEFVEGQTLSDVIKQNGPMPFAEAIHIFIQICFGLAYAHERGVVHRDLKPNNIMLTRSSPASKWHVKIVDFGIAKLTHSEFGESLALTRTGEIFGSPLYMSPEQCLGKATDHRTDIYSLGCTIFEVLTGAPPFHGENALTMMMQHQVGNPPTLQEVSMGLTFPDQLQEVLSRLLAKEPDARYQKASNVAKDLMSISLGQSIAQSPAVQERKSLTINGRSVHVAIFASIICSVFYGVLVWNVFLHPYAPSSKALSEMNLKAYDADGSNESIRMELESHTPYFSNPVGDTEFRFPKNISLGILSLVNMDTQISPTRASAPSFAGSSVQSRVRAQGLVTLPKHSRVSLEVSSDVGVFPQLLRRFGPEDLDSITLNQLTVRDDTLFYLSYLTGLKSLTISEPSDITDKGLSYLNSLPNLRKLSLSGTSATGDGVSKLSCLKKLEMLSLAEIEHGQKVIAGLNGSRNIKRMSLCDSDLSNRDVDAIADLSQLNALDLSGNTHITDAGISYLRRLKNLNELSLNGCLVTPGSIDTLSAIKGLTQLKLSVSGWSREDFRRLKLSLPGCRITLRSTSVGDSEEYAQ